MARGLAELRARAPGDLETRGYNFMADTGSTFLALPQEEAGALGLRRDQAAVWRVSATGPVDVGANFAEGEPMVRESGAP